MKVLIDYNLEGYAAVFSGILNKWGWIELLGIELITFKEVGLSMESSDRQVWYYARKHQMAILTGNRNMKGEDSLEQVMREENKTDSLPVLTISNLERLSEFDYRERCIERLIEIAIDIDNYRGAGRLFIP